MDGMTTGFGLDMKLTSYGRYALIGLSAVSGLGGPTVYEKASPVLASVLKAAEACLSKSTYAKYSAEYH